MASQGSTYVSSSKYHVWSPTVLYSRRFSKFEFDSLITCQPNLASRIKERISNLICSIASRHLNPSCSKQFSTLRSKLALHLLFFNQSRTNINQRHKCKRIESENFEYISNSEFSTVRMMISPHFRIINEIIKYSNPPRIPSNKQCCHSYHKYGNKA